jgi:hypothetical protein
MQLIAEQLPETRHHISTFCAHTGSKCLALQ